MRMFASTPTSSRRCRPSRSGQKGMNCISPAGGGATGARPGRRHGGGGGGRAGSAPAAGGDEIGDGGKRDVLVVGGAPVRVFAAPRREAPLAQDQAVWNAEQLGIGKLDARAGVTIVVEYLDAGGAECRVQRVGGGAHRC